MRLCHDAGHAAHQVGVLSRDVMHLRDVGGQIVQMEGGVGVPCRKCR